MAEATCKHLLRGAPDCVFCDRDRLRVALKAVLDRNFEAPNGIWSMPHNVESMKRELREVLGSPEQRSAE